MNAEPKFRALVDRYGWRAGKRIELYQKALTAYERALKGWQWHGMAMRSIEMADEFTAEDLVSRVRRRYSEGRRYAVFDQMAAGTGAGANSWIDIAVFALWPSDGLHRMAFEVKTTRGDFIRELEAPAKNAWARKCFHEFWFVAPKGAIKEEELPEGDGWLAPRGDGLAIVRAARRRCTALLDNDLLASVCRSAQKSVDSDLAGRTRQLIEDDRAYKDAIAYREGCESFLRERGQEGWSNWTADDVLNALRRASSDDAWRDTKRRLEEVLAHFRGELLELFPVWLAVAHAGLLEVDEAGEGLVKAWGASQLDLLTKRARAGDDPRAAAKASLAKLAKHFDLPDGHEED
jgi:hypothetical protein